MVVEVGPVVWEGARCTGCEMRRPGPREAIFRLAVTASEFKEEGGTRGNIYVNTNTKGGGVKGCKRLQEESTSSV